MSMLKIRRYVCCDLFRFLTIKQKNRNHGDFGVIPLKQTLPPTYSESDMNGIMIVFLLHEILITSEIRRYSFKHKYSIYMYFC